jgi:hypothetical protein
LVFAFAPEADPTTTLKVTVEINPREHDRLYGLRAYPFQIQNPWFTGSTSIASFEPEELQEAFERVWFRLIARLRGDAWHRSEPVIEELRATAFPNLLRNASV